MNNVDFHESRHLQPSDLSIQYRNSYQKILSTAARGDRRQHSSLPMDLISQHPAFTNHIRQNFGVQNGERNMFSPNSGQFARGSMPGVQRSSFVPLPDHEDLNHSPSSIQGGHCYGRVPVSFHGFVEPASPMPSSPVDPHRWLDTRKQSPTPIDNLRWRDAYRNIPARGRCSCDRPCKFCKR